LRTPVRQACAYLDARKIYDEAEKMPEGPSATRSGAGGGGYKVALDAAPDRDEAPEAAMNGAYAYKQVASTTRPSRCTSCSLPATAMIKSSRR
jgi:hypothetical protein